MSDKVVLTAEFATDEAAQAFMDKADALLSTAWFWIPCHQAQSKPAEPITATWSHFARETSPFREKSTATLTLWSAKSRFWQKRFAPRRSSP